MSVPPATIFADRFLVHLAERHRLSEVSAERVRRVHQETLDRLAGVLLKLGLLSELDLAAEMAAFSAHPLINPSDSLQMAESGSMGIADSFLRAHQLVPLAVDESAVTVACWDALVEYR